MTIKKFIEAVNIHNYKEVALEEIWDEVEMLEENS